MTTGMAVEGPLMARTESRDQYESARSKGGSASPNSTISSIRHGDDGDDDDDGYDEERLRIVVRSGFHWKLSGEDASLGCL